LIAELLKYIIEITEKETYIETKKTKQKMHNEKKELLLGCMAQ